MNKILPLVMLVVGLCLSTAVHYWLARRLIGPWATTEGITRILWIILITMAPVSVIGIAAGRLWPSSMIAYIMTWIGFVMMGWVFLAIFLVLVRDLFLGAWWLAQKLLERGGASAAADAIQLDPERRQTLVQMTSLAVATASSALSANGIRSARKTAAFVHQDILIQDLDPQLEGLTIMQLSDIHVGDTIHRGYLERIVEKCKTVQPDLLVITGDLVDQSVQAIADDVAPIFELTAPLGVYFVTGNHEYYVNARAWVKYLKSQGMNVLIDEHRVLEHQGVPFVLAGITDHSAPRMVPEHTSDPVKAFAGAPTDTLRILLAHQPVSYHKTRGLNVDLQLSGHTHGGQIWPFSYLVYLQQPFVAGLHRVFESTQVYISRGTGYWGPPMRIAAPSEITLLTLKRSP